MASEQRARLGAGALLLLVGVSVACQQLKPVERRAVRDQAIVEGTVPAAPEAVRNAIVAAFSSGKSQLPERWRRFSVARSGDEYFPADFQMDRERAGNDALARYRALPADRRRDDLFLYDFGDADDAHSYWPSEYYVDGRAAPFRSNFLVHLAASAADAALVDVIEVSPRVWAGKKFSFEAHGPGTYLDVRDVAPTTADRVELLDLVRRLTADGARPPEGR